MHCRSVLLQIQSRAVPAGWIEFQYRSRTLEQYRSFVSGVRLKATRRLAPAQIRLRGTTVPVIAVMFRDGDPQRLEAELQRKIQEASDSLTGGLGVIDVSAVTDQPLDLDALAAMVKRLGLLPVALQGADPAYEAQARALGLAMLPAEPASTRTVKPIRQVGEAPPGPSAASPADGAQVEPEAPAEPAPAGITQEVPPAPAPAAPRSALVLSAPLRSGQRVYARERDVVLLSSASPGSELIADGHIHCYGPLRGRAVAGASGDTSAQVFALDFQAELVAIAGVYKAFEQLPHDLKGKAVRVSLRPDGDHPHIDVVPLA
jgi:septum site-determining protein MinC